MQRGRSAMTIGPPSASRRGNPDPRLRPSQSSADFTVDVVGAQPRATRPRPRPARSTRPSRWAPGPDRSRARAATPRARTRGHATRLAQRDGGREPPMRRRRSPRSWSRDLIVKRCGAKGQPDSTIAAQHASRRRPSQKNEARQSCGALRPHFIGIRHNVVQLSLQTGRAGRARLHRAAGGQ